MTDAREAERRAGTVLTFAGSLMLPVGFFVIAGWRDAFGEAVPIGVAVMVVGIAAGVVGLLLRWGQSQK